MKNLLIIPVLFIAGIIAAQDALLKIPVSGATINAFIPTGYDTIATATGDLNKDGISDKVLVLASRIEKEDEIDMDSMPPRILVVLFNTGKAYNLVVKTTNGILCKDCGGIFGDPFEGVTVERGVLSIFHYGGSAWRWSLTHKFRYQQNDFYLIGQTTLSYWNVARCDKLDDFAGTDFKDENLITGAYEQKKISQEGCKLLINKKGKQKVKPLVKLTEFKIEN